MRIARDGMIDLTWREALGSGLRLNFLQRWLATPHHKIAIWFRGHRDFNVGAEFVSEPIPGTGRPICADCKDPLGTCLCR